MGGIFVDLPIKKSPSISYLKSTEIEGKPKFVQQGSTRLPKGSSYQAQSNRESAVARKLQKDWDLIDHQKRIVLGSLDQEIHQLRMQLRDIEEGKLKVSPYLTDVDAARLSVSSMGPTPRLVMEPIVSITKSDLAKQRAKLLQREYKKQNEMNEYLNQLFKTISDRNIKELSTLATHTRSNTKSKFSSQSQNETEDVCDELSEHGSCSQSRRPSQLELPRLAPEKSASGKQNGRRNSRLELPGIETIGDFQREKSKVSFKMEPYEDNPDKTLEQEVSKMATNLLELQKRSGGLRKKLTNQSMVWTDGSLALSLRKLRREKNQAEDYVIKNSSSSRALLAATRDNGDIDRSKTVVIQKGKLKLMFVADDRAKRNRDHRKFQSGRNQKIEGKILTFVHK